MMTEEEATKRGEALIERLDGEGWELELSRMEGWHYSAKLAGMIVYPAWGGGYFALLSTDGSGGYSWWIGSKTFKDPNEAVRYQIRIVRERLQPLIELVELHEKLLEEIDESEGGERTTQGSQ